MVRHIYEQPTGKERGGRGKKAEAAGSSKPDISGASGRLFAATPYLDAVLEAGGVKGVVTGAETRWPESSGMNLELLGE